MGTTYVDSCDWTCFSYGASYGGRYANNNHYEYVRVRFDGSLTRLQVQQNNTLTRISVFAQMRSMNGGKDTEPSDHFRITRYLFSFHLKLLLHIVVRNFKHKRLHT